MSPEDIERAHTHLRRATQLAAKRISANWDPEAKRYTNREEVDAMHDIMNACMVADSIVRHSND